MCLKSFGEYGVDVKHGLNESQIIIAKNIKLTIPVKLAVLPV
jgi:hypothetical protein